MSLKIAKTAGFCMGVRRAVDMVMEAATKENARPIYTFGPLIHNPQVLRMLEEKNIRVLDDIPENGSGTVLIRAHGVQPDIKGRLIRSGFSVLDATCPRVVKIQNIIKSYTDKGYDAIIIGDRTHPEVLGLVGYASGRGHVVGEFDELDELPVFEQAVVVAQSTQNILMFERVQDWVKSRYPHYILYNTICDSTGKRQAEIKQLAQGVDSVVVVGGRNSGNTQRLAEIARENGKPAYHIETEADLDANALEALAAVENIGITGGASTPNWVIENVYKSLQVLQDKPTPEIEQMVFDGPFTHADRPDLPPTEIRAMEDRILQEVSRSFALTIPQLPEQLRKRVTNAYLMCRIIDTIEDDQGLTLEEKERFFGQFDGIVNGTFPVERFVRELYPRLSPQTPLGEKDLIEQTGFVLRTFSGFGENQKVIIKRCLKIMATGMLHFQKVKNPDGLNDLTDMNAYCYHVAGVVGEMLTGLFCDYSAEIAVHREQMMDLAASFGQGLQMTNILKDLWEDRRHGACWLPRDIFREAGFDIRELDHACGRPQFEDGLTELIGIAHGHLRNALDYTLLIPKHETGIRKFCLWAIGMAVLTLYNIYRNKRYASGEDVKVSRKHLKMVIVLSNMAVGNDYLLKALFQLAARRLPLEQERIYRFKPSEYFVEESTIYTRIDRIEGNRSIHDDIRM